MQPIVVIYLLWVMWFLTWLAAAMGTHYPHRKLSSLQNFIYRLTTLVATFLLFTITPWPGLDVQYRFWERALDENLSWLLVGIAFAGFCLAWWSTVHRIVRRHRVIVDDGPYRIVRHPIYVGLIIAASATAVMFGRPSSLTGALLLAVAFVVKILIEERVWREETFAYDDYIGRVPMLVPFFPTRDRPVRHAHVAPPSTMTENSPLSIAREAGPAPSPLVPELFPMSATGPQTEAPLQDVELDADLGLEPRAATTRPVQLTLLLDDSKGTEATDRESPRDPSSSDLRPTSAV